MRNNEFREERLPSTPIRCAFDIINGIIFLAMIVVGVVKWHQCPVQPYIPKCLVASGVALILLGLIDKLAMLCSPSGNFRKLFDPALKFFFGTAIGVVFIILAILIFGSFGVKKDCDVAAYYFSVLVLIIFAAEVVGFIAMYVAKNAGWSWRNCRSKYEGADDRSSHGYGR